MSDRCVQMIRNTRLRFGEPPRQFAKSENAYLKMAPPAWCKPGKDLLHTVYNDREMLLREGKVVWGHLIQANSMAFNPGPDDVPGDVAFCPEPHWHDDLLRLGDMAKKLFEIKGAGSNTEERAFGKQLAHERDRFVSQPIPKSISLGSPVVATSFMVVRKHLPLGVLLNSYFPLLTHPKTKAVMVLPARYWDRELFDLWIPD